MGKKGSKSRGKEKARDLDKCLANEKKALEALGAMVRPGFGVDVDEGERRVEVGGEGREDVERKDVVIMGLEGRPLSFPPVYRQIEATKGCLVMASLLALRKNGEPDHVRAWVRQAAWIEEVSTGGSTGPNGLFGERFQGLLKELGLSLD